MTTKEFKKIAQLLNRVYKELELEALKEGVNMLSQEYDVMVANAREAVLRKFGFTVEEYRQAKEQSEIERRGERPSFEELKSAFDDYRTLPVLTRDEVKEIAHEVAKEYITEPQVINKIVKEIKIQTPPQIIKETIHTTERVEYDAEPLKKEIEKVSKKVDEIKIPELPDLKKFRDDLKSEFSEEFKHNIDTLGMPDFRKLAMGLRADIDNLSANGTGGGASAFTDLTDAPSSYASQALKVVRVNAGETGLEFTTLAGGGDALTADPLSQFASTTSLQLKGVISDETGSGALVFADTPTLVTPEIGEATGTGLTLSGLTASELVITNGSKKLVSAAVATYPSLTELTYLKGVTSAIQTQLNAKAATLSGTINEIAYFDSSSTIASLAVATYPSLTELSYVKGVTSAIQTQLGTKAATATTITIAGTANQITSSAGAQDLSANRTWTLSLPNDLRLTSASVGTNADSVPTLSSTSTLTNKRITQRVVTTTDDATAAIDVDVTDVYELSAIANATTFTLTGTPTDGQKLIVRYKDAGVAKGLTWTGFTAIGITLPTTTTASKWGYVGCTYNSAASQWHAVATVTQA